MYNKTIETATMENLKGALAEVNRGEHYKSSTPPEDMKNNRKGKGAQDMMKPADDAIANPAADEEEMVNKDAKKMTSNVKVAGGPPKKNSNKGDSKVVPAGTPMKDPAAAKNTNEEINKNIAAAYEAVQSAAKKPENYIDDQGVQRTRQVKSNRKVVDSGSHNEELKGGQKKLDMDKDGDIDKHDFKALRNKKKNESVDPWADMDLDEDPFVDVPSRPQWITDAYNEMNEDEDNKMFVMRKQAQVNQRRINKGMKPVTPLHPDHKNLIKPKNKKVGMSEKSSVDYKAIDGKTVTEISKDLTRAYMKGRSRDMFFTGKKAGEDDVKSTIGMDRPSYKKSPERKAMKMMKGMDMAANKLTGKAKVPAQGKTGRRVRDQY